MNAQEQPGRHSLPLGGVAVLACICLASGLGVGTLYCCMKDDIEAKRRGVFYQTLAVVLGEAEQYPTLGHYEGTVAEEDRVYVRQGPSGALYAATGTAQGYQSRIKVLVSVRGEGPPDAPLGADPVIERVAVVSSQETPGLGQNISLVEKDVSIWAAVAGRKASPTRPRFQEQFHGKRLSDLVILPGAEGQEEGAQVALAAVTGATISSQAATEAARRAVKRIIERTAEVYER